MKFRTLKKYNYISFDLFDTVITRQYMRPTDLFTDMEVMLSRESEAFKGFSKVRQQSEFDIRERSNFQQEVTLEEIYREVGARLGWDRQRQERFEKVELSFEEASIRVNRRVGDLLPLLRRNGKQIIFITDTYLPKSFISKILTDKGILSAGDKLFVSSDTGKMKAHGSLFEHVLQTLHPIRGKMVHVGDNYESDFLSAERYGIKGIHYTEVTTNRYEDTTCEDPLLSKIVATSKITRLHFAKDNYRQKVIWDVSANVSAPLIFSFTCWCLQQAIASGLNTIYFLSRDGQIMHAMAQRIIGKYFEGQIEAKYLYVSRQALLFPALTSLDDEALEWIMAPTTLLTPRIVLKRINFRPDELANVLLKYGFAEFLDEHILPGKKRQRFREMLKEVEKKILHRAEEYRQRAHDYFHQEGLTRQEPFAVVDIGWSGTLQRSISRMLEMCGVVSPVYGYYFGLRNRKKHKFQDMLFSWFTDYSYPRSLDKETYIVPMTELFTAADHGGVVAYEKEGERTVPRLKSETNATGLAWGVKVQQEAMTLYCDTFLSMGLDSASLEQVSNKYLDHYEQQYRQFLFEPTYMEAKVYGGFRIAEDQNEAYHRALAKKYSPRQLWIFRKRGYRHHHNEWQEGAMQLTHKALRKAFSIPEVSSPAVQEKAGKDQKFFYLVSFPRSGNTWMVNSLKDYLNAQRAELLPSGYIGEEVTLHNGAKVKLSGGFEEGLPLGIKTHMHLSEFQGRDIPGGKIVYLYRDPRDVMISYFFYLNSFLKKESGDEVAFTNERFAKHLREFLPAYKSHVEGWLKEYNGCIFPIQYEELKQDYMATLKKEQSYLMLDEVMSLTEVKYKNVDNFKKIDKFTSVLKGDNSDFYRKGIVGDWVNYFTEEHKTIVKEEVGDLLITLGYTENLTW